MRNYFDQYDFDEIVSGCQTTIKMIWLFMNEAPLQTVMALFTAVPTAVC